MPLSEVYTALQTGVIDGMDIDLDALMTEKYYETSKDLTITNHMTFPAVFVFSEKFMKAFPKKIRPLLMKLFNEPLPGQMKKPFAARQKH